MLSVNPNELLSQLNNNNFTPMRSVGTNKVLIDFGRSIGTYYQNGTSIGQTNFGMVHMGNHGVVHIVPANPRQF